MTKQELYRDLCIEAGTFGESQMTANDWYIECSHNITPDLDESLVLAAAGDVAAIAESRRACGLPILV